MQPPALRQVMKARLQPKAWGFLGIFLFLVVWIRILSGEKPSPGGVSHLVHAVLMLVCMVVLAPLPWQWTGDERRKTPLLRGAVQAILWNTLWLGPLVLTFGPAPRLVFANSHVQLSPMAGLLAGLHPVALVVGWIIAELQAAQGDRAEALAARQTLEITARQAQEQALKAQLDPHVLYNALGGISELIRVDPARAEEAVVSLGELYRKLTAHGRQERVRLAEERALVEDYLAVERLRLGDRLQVQWDWPEDVSPFQLPPLLLQPLVENAIKHGLSPSKQGGVVRISAALEGPGLRLRVADNGAPLEPAWQAGTGLANLGSRLALLGGGSGIALRQEGAWTRADLRLWPGGVP
jgi:two-component sensor histidine kinase